ncbi:hypothetical protein [Paenibacillus sp. TH7-28]
MNCEHVGKTIYEYVGKTICENLGKTISGRGGFETRGLRSAVRGRLN